MKRYQKHIYRTLYIVVAMATSGYYQIFSTYAQSDNITSPEFMVEINKLAPVWANTQLKRGELWFRTVLEKISEFMLVLVPILAVIAILVAGYFFIFSYTSDENTARAKKILKYNILAILVAFFSYAIIQSVVMILNATNK